MPQQTVTHEPQPFERTPIYKSARLVALNAQHIVANMPKKHKYSTGQKLNDACFDLIEAVSWAYVQQDIQKKALYLRQAYRKTMSALIIHRIASDLNLMARQIYIEQVSHLVSILKQTTGWLNKTGQKLPHESRETARAGQPVKSCPGVPLSRAASPQWQRSKDSSPMR